MVGDLVEVSYDDGSFRVENGAFVPVPDGGGIAIDRVCDRRCALIRPPMANLDVLFVTVAAAAPDPVLETLDKLISIGEFNSVEPVIVVTKSDLSPAYADELCALYRGAGFTVFRTGLGDEEATTA